MANHSIECTSSSRRWQEDASKSVHDASIMHYRATYALAAARSCLMRHNGGVNVLGRCVQLQWDASRTGSMTW